MKNIFKGVSTSMGTVLTTYNKNKKKEGSLSQKNMKTIHHQNTTNR